MNELKIARAKILASMIIFGTLGLFTKTISLPSSLLASARGFIGVAFLLIFLVVRGKKISFSEMKNNALWLCLSGSAIGFNWIFLFESYRLTGVPTATLCYYLAPAIVVFVSPLILRERAEWVKLCAALVALLGMVPISGVLSGGTLGGSGILFGVAAAVLYASVILMNKKIHDISDYGRTVAQLLISAVVVLPYALLTSDLSAISLDAGDILLTIAVGVLHTGIAYALYFSAMGLLSAQTTAILSYIDPVVAVFLSAAAAAVAPSVFSSEKLAITTIIGGVLILGSSLFAETFEGRKK